MPYHSSSEGYILPICPLHPDRDVHAPGARLCEDCVSRHQKENVTKQNDRRKDERAQNRLNKDSNLNVTRDEFGEYINPSALQKNSRTADRLLHTYGSPSSIDYRTESALRFPETSVEDMYGRSTPLPDLFPEDDPKPRITHRYSPGAPEHSFTGSTPRAHKRRDRVRSPKEEPGDGEWRPSQQKAPKSGNKKYRK